MTKAVPSENSEQLAWQAMETGAYDEAVRLLEPLAHRNSEWALLSLGWIYETGVTAPPDMDAALALYARAASQGSAAGCLTLAVSIWCEGMKPAPDQLFEQV